MGAIHPIHEYQVRETRANIGRIQKQPWTCLTPYQGCRHSSYFCHITAEWLLLMTLVPFVPIVSLTGIPKGRSHRSSQSPPRTCRLVKQIPSCPQHTRPGPLCRTRTETALFPLNLRFNSLSVLPYQHPGITFCRTYSESTIKNSKRENSSRVFYLKHLCWTW